jgi:hypothetical protein
MDKSIRRNEHCIVGLPSCDFVFSSTRSCFIAYGFDESSLEMSLLRKLLEGRNIVTHEASGSIASGQNAFCTKICSKIITAQFCIVLLNNSEQGEHEIPSANVNMEYGLMLGFNKYVIPFQRASQKLPFNVSGLDTVKYTNRDFEKLAADAIDRAIAATQQSLSKVVSPDQNLSTFLLAKGVLVATIADQGEKSIFELGRPLGFNLLHDFAGKDYFYFGNFTMLRPEAVLWRVSMLEEILNQRASTLPLRLQLDMVTPTQFALATNLFTTVRVWLLVTSNDEKDQIIRKLQRKENTRSIEVFSLSDVATVLATLPYA